MTVSTTTAFFAPAGPHLLQRKTHGLHAFILAAVLITVSALTGCGGSGSVSTTDAQPSTGSVSLTWSAPTTNADGTQLTDLTGYKVYYGTKAGLYHSINVGAADSFEVTGLAVGQTYYFAVTAYDASGSESDYSDVISKLVS